MNKVLYNTKNNNNNKTTKMNTELELRTYFKRYNLLINTPGITEDEFVRALTSSRDVPQEPVRQEIVKKVKKVKKIKKSNIPMPWSSSPQVNEDCCYALRVNSGLFTQCTKTSFNMDTEIPTKYHLCKTCCDMVDNHESGKHPYGYVQDRVLNGDLWRSPSGKAPVRLVEVLKKKKITNEAAQEEADRLGLVIPDIEFVEKPKRRGRPKLKSAVVSDTDDEEVEQQEVIKNLVTRVNPKENDKPKNIPKKKAKKASGKTEKQIKKLGLKAAKAAVKIFNKRIEDNAKAALKAAKAAKKAADKADKAAKKAVDKAAKAAKKAADKAAKKKAAPAKGEFKTAQQLLRVDGSNIEGLRVMPSDGRKSVLRYQVHRKSGLAVKKVVKNYTEEGHARFAELFGSDGRKNVVEEVVEEKVDEVVEEVVEEKVEEVVEEVVEEKVEEVVEEKVEEVVEEKVEEVVEEKVEEKPVNESNHDSGNDQVLSDIELSELDEEDYDDEQDEAESFDVTLNAFADEDTGYYKTKDDDFIYNQDGDCVGEMMDGEFVQGEYS